MRYNLKTTPEGTRDILFEECDARNEVKERLAEIFRSRGYSDVVTPTLEYFDIFSKGSSALPQQSMYKLTGNKGHLLVMRPDITTPIARLAAARLSDFPLPIRLCYCQSVFKATKSFSGQNIETLQSGVELLGAKGLRADLEIITTAGMSLDRCGISKFRLEIGHVDYYKEIFASMNLSEEIKTQILEYIEAKNYAALNNLLDELPESKQSNALRKLPRLFGGIEILDEAKELFSTPKSDASLEYLRKLVGLLEKFGLRNKVTIDLGIVNRNDYYTGLVFRGYVEGSGNTVLTGGRYDNLAGEFGNDIPSIGFAVDVDAVADALVSLSLVKEHNVDIAVFGTDGYELAGLKYAELLIANGKTVENCVQSDLESAKEYAAKKGIGELHVVSDKIEILKIAEAK